MAPARLPLIAFLLVALSLVAVRARASLVVVKPGGDAHASEARVAFAKSAARTVAWEQLALDEARGELAWVVAVPRGGWIEPADDHWFEALDEATAAVIAPAKSLSCSPLARETTAAPRSMLPPRPIGSALSPLAPAAAIDKLVSLGFVVDSLSRARILALEPLREDVAILLLPAGARGVTRVVRVLGPSSRAFPATLVPSSGGAAKLAGYVFAEGRARFAGVPQGEVDNAKLSWIAGASNYDALLANAITTSAPGYVATFAGIDGVLVDQPAGAATTTLASVARRYFGAFDDTASAESWSCAARAAGLATSAKLVAPSCSAASPYMPGAPAPACAVVDPATTPSSQLSCGRLDDLAVAAGGFAPARLALTRVTGHARYEPGGYALETFALGSIPSYREAKLGPSCTAGAPSDPPGNNPGGDPGAPGPTTPADDDPPPSTYSSSSSDGCGSTAQVFADSCTSSSSGGGGCGGDSSSSDSCSGDSSSGDSCSGSSDSADDGCSSSDSGSSSCKGASDSADDGCRAARARPRLRFSAAMYLLIAFATIARRLGRRYDRAADPSCPSPTNSSSAPGRE